MSEAKDKMLQILSQMDELNEEMLSTLSEIGEDPGDPPIIVAGDFLEATENLYRSLDAGIVGWRESVISYIHQLDALGIHAVVGWTSYIQSCGPKWDELHPYMKKWASQLGDYLAAEAAEPGGFRGITLGEVFDALWYVLDKKIKPTAIGELGFRNAMNIVGAYQACKFWAQATGEVLGAGEKTPPDLPTYPPGWDPPWSGG